jgi:hypothetical protein
MTSQIVHIDIDVCVDGNQITGHAGDGASQPRPFHGWLGLISELDRLMTASVSAKAPVPSVLTGLDPGARHARAGLGSDR